MGKRNSIKRLSSSISQSTSNAIDIKARKRIEQLYELTDEIINAYNEINEKYVNQIYRKYKQLQKINKNLKEELNQHHCNGCKCNIQSNEEESEKSEEEEEEADDEADEQTKNPTVPSSTTSSIITRSKKKNPFIISDVEDTQNFDANDSRFDKSTSDDEDKITMDTNHKTTKNNNNNNESEQESEEEEVDEDNGMARLPIVLQNVIQRKAEKNKNAKAYLLEIPRYPALCEFLRDKSSTSFDHRPSENQVRPLIANHISKNLANDSKIRMRLRDELREIHRSYMRTFMTDPHASGSKSSVPKTKQLTIKKSPM